MPDAFTFNVNDIVQFKDGRNIRVGFVTAQNAPDDDHSVAGYTILFFIPEANNGTGQNRSAWWAADGVTAGKSPEFKFKVGDSVKVDVEGGQAGKVVQASPIDKDNLENHYAVQFQSEANKTDLAWWQESILAAA